MSATRFTITTPIYYLNDQPHLGHAYTTVAADALARWHRMNGRDVFFLTGTDEHGQKVYEAALKRGLTPEAFVDGLVGDWRALWVKLNISNDDFIRTTEPRHVRVVQAVLQRLWDNGDIYAADYEGWYSTAAERFWTEKDLVNGNCPDSGQPVHWVKERNYFFRMSRYADQLRDWIDAHPQFLRPEIRRNEILGYLKKEVGDLCISRPASRLPWGIPLPFAPEFVTYVWVDALTNYISALGYGVDDAAFAARWPADVQLMGKEILTVHAVYWSTMLFALGLEPATTLFAHGWWTVEGQKMSKSLGNMLDPHLLIDCYGVDAVRYFLLRDIPFGLDGDFSHNVFLLRTNADLANDLGNLAHRALSMTEKWLGGRVPALDASTPADAALEALAARTFSTFKTEFEALSFSRALDALWELVGAGNKYIDSEQPWKLNREGQTARLGGVMRRCLEICRIAAALLTPVIPEHAALLAQKLGLGALNLDAANRLDGLPTGGAVAAGEPLFPRMLELPAPIQALLERTGRGQGTAAARAERPPRDKTKTPASPPTALETAPMSETAPLPETAPAPEIPLIAIEDFQKVQLRTGRVLSAARHPSADRLLVLQVDVGEAEPRTIVAGIAARYAPEDLVGLGVVVVINLKPVKLRGILSQGMLLAAGGGQVKAMATVTEDVPPGTVVR